MVPYKDYKYSNNRWIGDIPTNWTVTKIKYCLLPGNEGIKIGPFGSALNSEFIKESGFKIYGQENVIRNSFSNGYKYIDEEKYLELSNYKIEPGDIVITMMGTTGKAKVVPDSIQVGIMDSHLTRVRVNKNCIMARLLEILINDSYLIATQVKYKSKGSIMDGLNSTIIKSLILPLPPIEEQVYIVYYLDFKIQQIDKLIADKQKLIELLNEERTAIINKAVTKGIAPNVSMVESGSELHGLMPSHWANSRLKYISEIFGRIGFRGYTVQDLVEKDNGAISLSPSNIKNQKLDIKDCTYLSWEKYNESPEIKIYTNDIIIVKTGSTIGKVALIPKDTPEMTLNPQLIVLKNIKVHSAFLYYTMTSDYFQANFKIYTAGGSTPAISQEKINNFRIMYPPVEEQIEIVNYLDEECGRVEIITKKVNSEIDFLKEYKTALISEVVTGKVDVRNEVLTDLTVIPS
jgi:type I restriction enzyme S subunit